MSEHSIEKPIAEQMLDWAERLDKRFYLFNKESLYNWLVIKAPRVAQLEEDIEKYRLLIIDCPECYGTLKSMHAKLTKKE